MTSLLPKLEDMLVDLLQFGDTGALRVSVGARRWALYVQGGVLVGIEGDPATPALQDGADPAAAILVEALAANGAIVEFVEGQGPAEFGLYDIRLSLGMALGAARPVHVLLEMLKPVLEGWPELRADPDTLSADPQVQAWLASLDGLALGNTRLLYAPPRPGPALGALWVAWKLGDLDLHAAAVDDDDLSSGFHPVPPREGAGPPGEPTAFDEVEEAHDDETVRSHGTAPTWTTAQTYRSAGPESGAVPLRPPRDPFLEGVSKANAGHPRQALPLLEAAWEEDPERPGLEEWLGYTRFAALRESDPEAAKAGLASLREVMYRTGPTGETPLLPWLLMARAQYERGDMVQARSLLDAVREREPDDAEVMHLDGLLKEAERKMAAIRQGRPPVSIRRILGMTGGVAILAALVTVMRVAETPRPIREDHAPGYQDLLPLRELHRLEGTWVGVARADWPGQADPALAQAACRSLVERAALRDSETLLLLSDAGVPLAECGERLRSGSGQ